MQNHTSPRSAIAAALALIASLGFTSTALAQMGPGGPPPVTVAKPVVKDIVEMDEYTGRFEASASVDVRARVNGFIDSMPFKEGAQVKEGELLVVIDRRPYQASLNQAQASLNAVQTRVDLAKLEFERYERLARSGTAAEAQLDQRRQALLSAQADLAGARAAVETTRLNLSFTEIRAPIAGRISRKLVTEGNLVRENETLLTTIVAQDPIYFYFDIDERSFLAYQRLAREGAPSSNGNGGRSLEIAIALADEKGFPHKGNLTFTDNRLDAATGTMRLRATLENKDLFLTPGLFGRIAVPGSPKYRGVLVPDEAILTDLGRRFVYVVEADGSVRQQPVKLGSRTDNYRIVREGLKGDETVVINGLQRVRMGGGKVTPMPVQLPETWAGLMALPQPKPAGGGAAPAKQ
ncbi:MAG: efflux RND transporter periplasmic adaptor subunit [Ferrovibrio sp.]|nr:efflux RND transporter periplasmic adaptor subunit [Ferrovibrio sp.]